ncbi:hypothetical protein B0H17DRAFT_1177911 [Mycena rosella]|uniref:Uncharacterized protein n=1 Tax=Mycena rosella TaxID=1033263 RepID=A0AAD7GIG7_MYCRO|nr:hypothetical protein B0H17DRAFT_1177911 [Mycena rosella]
MFFHLDSSHTKTIPENSGQIEEGIEEKPGNPDPLDQIRVSAMNVASLLQDSPSDSRPPKQDPLCWPQQKQPLPPPPPQQQQQQPHQQQQLAWPSPPPGYSQPYREPYPASPSRHPRLMHLAAPR